MCGENRENFPVVIVIGDDASFRETLSKLCHSVGLNVLAFESIAGLLRTKLPDAPSCLVINVSSPSLGGVSLQAELARADVQIPIVPVIGAMNTGGVEILTKRFRYQHLLATIQIALKMDHAQRDVAKRVTPH
jgi:FixJ family two-component response regulator